MSQVLLFQAGGLRYGVSLADISRLVVEDVLVPVPFSHPAMAGLIDAGPDGPVPVFDLKGLVNAADVASHRVGATVALFPTLKGPVGLRIDQLLGTAASYQAIAASPEVPRALAPTVSGTAKAEDAAVFSFFSPEAFLAAIGL